ncbi:MAG TPA: hypothetical protein PKD48_04450 [Sphingopyxis sp.]|nr:hypothetical protein [Sphingopyxis sp.]HMQ18070.1 hypothetical protein [Sphingopyxis sp.]
MTMKLEGAGELGRGLKALARPDELDTIKLAALMEAGEPVRDAVKLEAPFDEGRLFTAIELEVDQPSPKKVPTRTGVAIWVKYTNDYRPLKRAFDAQGRKRKGWGRVRDYQEGSIPSVYGAFLNFVKRFGAANDWMLRGWRSAGGGEAATRQVSQALNWSLVSLVRRRLSGK